MELSKYPLASSDKMLTFEFISEGNKGMIHKLVEYQPTNLTGVYNLAFGDKNAGTGKIDDETISNNGDSEKVLATVSNTIYAFTDKYPNAWIYAAGNNKARTRLYRMGISKFHKQVKNDFEIQGELENGWEDFELGTDYEGFLFRRKNKK
jgi:hypothetical protein